MVLRFTLNNKYWIQDRGTCEAPERPEGEQEQLVAGPSANIAFERQVR